MNIQNLSKQLEHEIAANPKKAILLGIMIAVGLYFWGPISWRWINKGKEDSGSQVGTQTVMNTSSGEAGSTNGTTTNKENQTVRHSWKEVVKWISNDPRTHPAESLTIVRDPFQGPKDAIANTMTENQANNKPPLMSPASLGMTLTSTLIGPQGAIARIGVRTYNQGQTVEVEKEGQKYKFVLSEIHDRQVILEAEGERFELSIPEPGKSSRMVLGTVQK